MADGYSGNIFLKTMEGTGLYLAKELKKMFLKGVLTKLAAVLVADGLKNLKKMMSSSEVGGTALLGISKPVIKAHGSSDALAIQNAVRQARPARWPPPGSSKISRPTSTSCGWTPWSWRAADTSDAEKFPFDY